MELPDDQLQAILSELRAGRKIQAIKIYRQYSEADLASAKTAVEQLAAKHGIEFPKSGCGAAAVLMLALPVLLYFCIR